MDAVELTIESVGDVVLNRNGEMWQGQKKIGQRNHDGSWIYLYALSIEEETQNKLEEAFRQLIG